MRLLAALTGKQPKRSDKAANDSDYYKSKYRGVEIIADGDNCCAAARKIAGKRFLSDSVPKLPLSGCHLGECTCTYQLFEDRRTDVRRASDLSFDLAAELHDDNKRDPASSGRRIDD